MMCGLFGEVDRDPLGPSRGLFVLYKCTNAWRLEFLWNRSSKSSVVTYNPQCFTAVSTNIRRKGRLAVDKKGALLYSVLAGVRH